MVAPYIHKMSHNLKEVANRYGVPVVSSAPQKMATICSQVHSKIERRSKPGCTKRHQRQFVLCTEGAVYKLPLLCGKKYVGQTDQYVSDRLRKHNYFLHAALGGHLPLHCKACWCAPKFERTTIKIYTSDYQKTSGSAPYSKNRGLLCQQAVDYALWEGSDLSRQPF